MTVTGPGEDETCRRYVRPALSDAGWSHNSIVEQFPLKAQASRRPALGDGVADYVLTTVNGLPLAVVEAKRLFRTSSDGLQQALRYAQQLGVPLAYSTNGTGFVEHNLRTGRERRLNRPASPIEAWSEFAACHHLDDDAAKLLDQPFNRHLVDGERVRTPRWYQARAVHEVLAAIARGEQRALVLMATGTGKTFTAMQLVHKLRIYEQLVRPERNYRVLYLADRHELLRSPQEKVFDPAFGQGPTIRVRGAVNLNREIYFATYQALVPGQGDDRLLDYPPDFFDLVIVDECHRGSAHEESLWRGVLTHFTSAVQVGLTATPNAQENAVTYEYFGNPVFTYTLRQGIEDGYLAPYDVLRVLPSPDADGWEPLPGEVDMHGNAVPEGIYSTRDFERRVSLLARTRLVANHLSRILQRNPGRRAIVFCVDTEHAQQMRDALAAANPQAMRQDPEWVVRIVGSEPEKDRLLEQFTSVEEPRSPIVATTSRLLSTGVDVVDLRYVVLFRPVGSSTEFKQIVGRGTRLYPRKDKTRFTVIDYVGASRHFLDPGFDGYPPSIENEVLEPDGTTHADPRSASNVDDTSAPFTAQDDPAATDADASADPSVADPGQPFTLIPGPAVAPRPPKLYIERDPGFSVDGELRFAADTSSGELKLVEFEMYLKQTLERVAGSADSLAAEWATPAGRARAMAELARAGISADELTSGESTIDVFDALVHLAWNTPMPTRAERARRARAAHGADIDALPEKARAAVEGLLQRYVEYGVDDITTAEVLTLPPLSGVGSRREITDAFGGVDGFNSTIASLQKWLYSA